MIDPSIFQGALEHGRSKINSLLKRPNVNYSPGKVQTSYNTKSNGKMRTDRHNNPTAFITQIAEMAGLKPGVDYVPGDPFPNNPNLRTAKLLGDPIKQTIRVIDNIGFYTATGKPRWTYINDLPNVDKWKQLDYNGKAQVIGEMYRHEGGDGSLMAGLNKPASPSTPSNNAFIPTNPIKSSPLFSFKGGGGPRNVQLPASLRPPVNSAAPVGQKFNNLNNLGNITTRFGEVTKDTGFHEGLDVANKQGTPIPKTGTGGVVEAVKPNLGDYGNQIAIRNQDGTREYYSHLHQMMVRPGQQIRPGQVIGTMGSTGNSWSPTGGDASHLHYEVKDPSGNFINPEQYLQT